MRKLNELNFENTYCGLPQVFYSGLEPTPIPQPYLVSFNPAAAALLDLDPNEMTKPEFVEYFGGRASLPGSQPVAMLYAGHQFGQYVPQLGDGRAILLGEVRNEGGAKWDLHLKGAGQTPYSRQGDGRAALRSTIREYLCGEAMHGLGVPTSRALCIIGSDMPVYRETVETAAVLLRLAESHVRFGSFEVFFYRGQYEPIKQLADYVIGHHFPELVEAEDKYARWLTEIVVRTARLMAQWQAVGFAHGVMNTDNMSILGFTLDYGPFGFLDEFDLGFICNHSDYGGRYAFGRQPGVAFWNLQCLAQTLLPLLTQEEAINALEKYEAVFNDAYLKLMRDKIGLQAVEESDAELLTKLFQAMQANQVDYTIFFRRLAAFEPNAEAKNDQLRDLFIDPTAFDAWAQNYRARLQRENSNKAARQSRMKRVNPKYVLRNYLAQTAIQRATEARDYSEIETLLKLLQTPFAEQPELERYAQLPPTWSKRIVVSCSS